MNDASPQLDYATSGDLDVANRSDLIDALNSHRGEPVRLLGSGSAQRRLPAPRSTPLVIRTSSMASIARLEPGDLTCSVEPGLPRETLDAALAEHDLWLPCAGTGTVTVDLSAVRRQATPADVLGRFQTGAAYVQRLNLKEGAVVFDF